MQGPWLNTLQNDGVHGCPVSTLQGACENGVASIGCRRRASADPAFIVPVSAISRQRAKGRSMTGLATRVGDAETKMMRATSAIKVHSVHIPAFTSGVV